MALYCVLDSTSFCKRARWYFKEAPSKVFVPAVHTSSSHLTQNHPREVCRNCFLLYLLYLLYLLFSFVSFVSN